MTSANSGPGRSLPTGLMAISPGPLGMRCEVDYEQARAGRDAA